MDPTRDLCKVRDSFEGRREKVEILKYTSHIPIGSPRTVRNNMRTEKTYEIKEREIIPVEEDLADPFRKYSSEVFSRESVLLANIDGVFNFSGQEDGYLKPQVIKDFSYACLDFQPEYIKYLQYRLPISVGFTACGTSKDDNIDYRLLNIACDEANFVNYVLKVKPYVDLVISGNPSNYQEKLSSALKLCKPGGTFIAKIDETSNDLVSHYITSLCFETFALFKPLSENLNKAYSYVIAQNYKGSGLDWLEFEKIQIPDSFLNYEKEYYSSLNFLKKNINEEYNLYKALALWNIF